MKSKTTLKSLYKTILNDCQVFLEAKINKSNEENKKKEPETIKNELDICEIIIHFMENYHFSKTKSKFITNSILSYIKEIKDYISCSNDFDSFINLTEHDFYRAYGLLWSFRYVFDSAKIEEISNFNYKDYKNFAEILKIYGMSKKLSKNYRENFNKSLGNLKLNENFIYKWLKILNEKKLSPLSGNTNNNIQNESIAKEDSKHVKSNEKTPLPKNVDEIDYLSQDNESGINNNNYEKTKNLKDNQIAQSEKIEKKSVKPADINQNNISIQNDSFINIVSNKINQTTSSNILNLNEKNIKSDISSKSTNEPKNKIKEKEDSKDSSNNQDIQQNNERENALSEKNDIPSFLNESQNIIQEKEDSKNIENDIQQCNEKEEKNKNQDNSNTNSEIEIKLLTDNNGNSGKDSIKKKNYSFDQLVDLVISLEDKYKKMKIDYSNVNERVIKLEINQCLMYHQLSLYENSRDIGRSINEFFFEYLDTKMLNKNNFEKIKTIIKCLEENFKNEKLDNIQPEMKQILVKYFRFHFFLNKVFNKIMHRNISKQCQNLLENQKENDISPLFPGFNFSQCFKSLEYFVDKSVNNPQVQTIMKYVYDNKYKNDKYLDNIFDSAKTVICPENDAIKINFNKNEIKRVKEYFESLQMTRYNKSFVELCDEKSWDEEEKKS